MFDSGPLILFVCAVIAVTIAHPYGHQELLTSQAFDDHHGFRNIELQPVTYHKRFHFFAAPEEDESVDELIPEELLKKTINVVVIKTPENNKANAVITRLAKALAEEKTAIYVLNKEPDVREVSTLIERLKQQKVTRPEVHIIKYKTPEEAALAARNIQVEYDRLSGPSEVGHQVTAALHSYVGLLDGAGIHEMMLLIYGKPFLPTSPEEVVTGDTVAETLPSSSFYLPPGGETPNPPTVTLVEESKPADSVDVVSASSLGTYLPPDTNAEALMPSSSEAVAEESIALVDSDIAIADPEAVVEELVISTTALPITTTKLGRGSYKYFHAETTTTERPTTISDLPDEYSSLTNNYLPPKEPKLRNKRLK